MPRLRSILGVLFACLVAASAAPALAGAPAARRYLVILSADPVSTVGARTSAKKLGRAEHDAYELTLRALQEPVARAVAERGGAVERRLTDTLNAIAVRIPEAEVAAVRSLPGVVRVTPITIFAPARASSLTMSGAPQVWGGIPGATGVGVKIAIVDEGIDYTHADFGGPGTPAAYVAARAAGTQPASPELFGPNAAKVKGGVDLVGDDYDPSFTDPAHAARPDANPLGCDDHGTLVGGVAGGFGVTLDRRTYDGPYDTNTLATPFHIAPGVAPEADLYSVRILGCAESVALDVLIAGLDWAVHNDMDVINLSIGGPRFATPDDPVNVAAANAAAAGIVVVAAAGNSGVSPFTIGAPAGGDGVIATAASHGHAQLPALGLRLADGRTVVALTGNGIGFPDGTALPLKVLRAPNGDIIAGCTAKELAGTAGALVARVTGTACGFFDTVALAEAAGARGVINLSTNPTYEDTVETRFRPATAIPIASVPGPASASDTVAAILAAADGQTLVVTAATVPNSSFGQITFFSSAGPRSGDVAFKPDITAPGISIATGRLGTGSDRLFTGGTSVAAPAVAGAAALVKQAHPTWSAETIRWALTSTADPARIVGYAPRFAGAGMLQVNDAVRTSVVARAQSGATGISFPLLEFTDDLQVSGALTLTNVGGSPVRVDATAEAGPAAQMVVPHTPVLSTSSLLIPPGQSRQLVLELRIPAATAGPATGLRATSGIVTFVPDDGGPAVRVPYHALTRARSDIDAVLVGSTLELGNASPKVTGTAELFTWGLAGVDDATNPAALRAVGARAFDGPGERMVSFALQTFRSWSNPAAHELHIFVDRDRDGTDDARVSLRDLGVASGFDPSGVFACVVTDLASGVTTTCQRTAVTANASAILTLPASALRLKKSSPPFSYRAVAHSAPGPACDADCRITMVPGTALFDAFQPAISDGVGSRVTVAPGGQAAVPLVFDARSCAAAPPLGVLILVQDNPSAHQARLVDVGARCAR